MTLKEKVAEMEPDAINESEPGGVMYCPGDYEYLNDGKIYGDCALSHPTKQGCNACWNREFVPNEDENKMTLKEKVRRVTKLCREQGKCDNCPVKQHSEEIGACTTNIFATVSEERLDAMLKCFDGEDCWNREFVPKEGEEMKTKLDKAIEEVAYILDCLTAYRTITEKGCCNDCKFRRGCKSCPKPGEVVRYNCPLYEREPEKDGGNVEQEV